MHASLFRWLFLFGLIAPTVGCAAKPAPLPPIPDTGAKQAVGEFYDALIRKDWKQAHARLSADQQRRISPDQFARLGQAYRRKLAFDLVEIHVRSCDEKGTEATAHLLLLGPVGPHRHRYNEGITLKNTGGTWGVVLPENFGKAK